VRKSAAALYAATVDNKVAMKVGAADWSPAADDVQARTAAAAAAPCAARCAARCCRLNAGPCAAPPSCQRRRRAMPLGNCYGLPG